MKEIYKIYEDVLSKRRRRFPMGFWKDSNAKENGKNLLIYIVNKLELTSVEIQEISEKKITRIFRLDGLYRLYDNDSIKLLKETFPELEFVNYHKRKSYREKQSNTIKNLSKEKKANILLGIKNRALTDEYREKLSDSQQGELNSMAKLTEKKVIEIKLKWGLGHYTTQSLGDQYGVKRQTIADIVYGRTWKNI